MMMTALSLITSGRPVKPQPVMTALSLITSGRPVKPQPVMTALSLITSGRPVNPQPVMTALSLITSGRPVNPQPVMTALSLITSGRPVNPQPVMMALSLITSGRPVKPQPVMTALSLITSGRLVKLQPVMTARFGRRTSDRVTQGHWGGESLRRGGGRWWSPEGGSVMEMVGYEGGISGLYLRSISRLSSMFMYVGRIEVQFLALAALRCALFRYTHNSQIMGRLFCTRVGNRFSTCQLK